MLDTFCEVLSHGRTSHRSRVPIRAFLMDSKLLGKFSQKKNSCILNATVVCFSW